jgi:putative nucleotidyltransferase with HDIG domain
LNDTCIQFLLDRASTEERGGHWTAALDLYAESLQAAVDERDAEAVREILLRDATCRRFNGDSELAIEILEVALLAAEQSGDVPREARALNGLAVVKHHAGDIEGAERLYLLARDRAVMAGNHRVVGECEQNLGILDNIRGDLNAALRHYRAGLTELRRAGQERACAWALNNLGMLHVDLNRLGEADAYFREALEIAERLEDVVTLGTLHINRTELYLKLGDTVRARASCDEGFEIASRVENHAHRAEALKFYGAIYRTTGKLHLAEIHLLQAIEITAGREPLLEAEAQRELSLVLRELGRNRQALTALNRAHALFSGLQAHADQADIHRRIGQLEEDFLSLVRFWGESIEAKDRYTGGHCARVADYACRLAEAVGFPEADLGWFRMGAYLHDIGKVEVSAEILNKPGRLTDEERALMERHTVIGDEMLSPVEFPWDIRPMVRSHHERWDGSGYPDRLEGEAIHYSARILRVADIFDALTTARSYRKPLTPDEAFTLMDNDEGSFDPELFEVFRGLFPELAPLAAAAGANPLPPDPKP